MLLSCLTELLNLVKQSGIWPPRRRFFDIIDTLINLCIYYRYMAKTVINIKADKEVKENAKKLAQELGVSLSDVISASLRNFIRTREFYVSAIPRMTPELERLIGRVEKDIQTKKNIIGPFSTTEEMDEYLDSL